MSNPNAQGTEAKPEFPAATCSAADDSELARTIAHIMWPSCGAAKAIAEASRRHANGESVKIIQHDHSWFVVPNS